MTPGSTNATGPHLADPQPARAEPAAAEPRPAALFMLPDQLLLPGEIIVLIVKPSAWFILLTSLQTLAILAVLTAVGWYVADFTIAPFSRRDVLLAGFCLAGLRLFWQFLEWLSRVYVLTDQRVVRVKGVLHVHVFECALKQVQHTQCLFSVRERLFGLGTLSFATAGTDVAEAYWEMLSRPLEVHQTVVRTLNRYR